MKRIPFALVLLGCHGAADATRADQQGAGSASPASSAVVAPASASAQHTSDAASAQVDLVARPYRLVVPDATDGGARPLVVLLHGYGSSGAGHDNYFGLSKVTRERGVLLAIVDGTRDPTGKLFWNATEACCNFYGATVDDVAYVDAVIDDIERKNAVDPARIYLLGHSNGAFMAHRFACDRSVRVAAIVALAGVPSIDESSCAGKRVSVLQVHGDADTIIDFRGGKSFGNGKPYPSALAASVAWASRDGCQATRTGAGPPLDLDLGVPGAETTRERYDCPSGIGVELWTMHGSGHIAHFGARFVAETLDFLLAHPKPK